ncbi:PEP-CTERM sorting domain-containing protein [Crocosphaera sp.]|uniref:choice-of-anchor E domain-containing protein n=1 Tax=Crocosphaera sp. TaxID=2729996 RepID=UPI0026049AF1|nr:PEP-CTERM sorting domain-containing protein [Crocosphaera sp.]MDJ0579267.1 choice-of-anchor E domain-containing protein [Crocosphaera sp.]
MVSILKAVAVSSLTTMVFAGTASAMSFTPFQEASVVFDSLDGDETIDFDGFDSSLGELIGFEISLEFDATLNNTALVFPIGSGDQAVGSPTPLTATATLTAAVAGALGLSVSDSLSTPGFVGDVPDNGAVNIVGTDSVVGQTDSETYSTADGDDLSSLIGGTNAVSILLSSVGSQGGSVPSDVTTGNNGNSDVTVRIRYEFETVAQSTPEPGMILGLATVAGAGLISRRRKNSH